MKSQEILDIDLNEQVRNRTWWWWWWIFFFNENDSSQEKKQLMVLWGTRNCRKLRVDGLDWQRECEITRSLNKADFYGLCTSWFFDGKRMIDPLFIAKGRISSRWSGDSGEMALQDGGSHTFRCSRENYRIHIDRNDVKVDIQVSPWTAYLWRLVRTGKRYFGKLGYSMLKIRGSKAHGTVTLGESSEELTGTCYFQKVRINSPTSPWYWGIFHSRNGSYIDYFIPHIGPPMIRRHRSHSSRLDWGEIPLSNSWQYYDGETKKLYRIRKVQIEKTYKNDLPIFSIHGREGARSLSMRIRTYARACWRVEQPLLRFSSTILHYNEYPARVEEFEFKEGRKETTLDDLGPTIGNCEHSWGIV